MDNWYVYRSTRLNLISVSHTDLALIAGPFSLDAANEAAHRTVYAYRKRERAPDNISIVNYGIVEMIKEGQ